jgi:pimeloyl-ACP methyl ester carboxylesterase
VVLPSGEPNAADLTDVADVLTPDLRGFGQSDKHEADPEEICSAHGQARAVAALMDELGLKEAIVAGYDVGGAVSQTIAAMRRNLSRPWWSRPIYLGQGNGYSDL